MAYVLIVDDDRDGREALSTVLLRSGFQVDCVSNGREALVAILGRLPDMLVLDLLMPEMDGAGLLAIVRSYLRLQALPVVLLTGLPDSPLVERARAMGVNAVLVKGKAGPLDVARTIGEELQRLGHKPAQALA